MRLRSVVQRADQIDLDQQTCMLKLMQDSYEDVTLEQFTIDLAAKSHVISLFASDDRLVGFSTQVIIETCNRGRPIHALYSGDTVVAREHWGDYALAAAWGNFALDLIDSSPDANWFWFLTSKGYRTYRYMPLFFSEFYPGPKKATPEYANEIMKALADIVAPDRFDRTSGIIRASKGKDRLRTSFGDPQNRDDIYVRYFIGANPGHAQGDELCCIAPLSRGNFTKAARRMIRALNPRAIAEV